MEENPDILDSIVVLIDFDLWGWASVLDSGASAHASSIELHMDIYQTLVRWLIIGLDTDCQRKIIEVKISMMSRPLERIVEPNTAVPSCPMTGLVALSNTEIKSCGMLEDWKIYLHF